MKGPEGQPLDTYRGVRRRDTSEIVSVVSSSYQFVEHREVAQAVHAIGEALGRLVAKPNAPALPREVGPRVSAERSRGFERIAASTPLVPGDGARRKGGSSSTRIEVAEVGP